MKPILIAGPCVIESEELLDTVAKELVRINNLLNVDIIFKASFDKANRTSLNSFRGPGLEKGLSMLADIKRRYQLRVTTDIHESWQAEAAGEVCDQDWQGGEYQKGAILERKGYALSCGKSVDERSQRSLAHRTGQLLWL